MKRITYPDLTLAVSLSARGFAYVFFEAPQTLFDWGMVEVKGGDRNEQVARRMKKLLCRYQPATLVLEDLSAKSAKRPDRTKKLALHLSHLAQCEGVGVAIYDRAAIRAAFAPLGAQTKVEIARSIGFAFPAFGHRLPPIRKIWMSEDPRQMLFDAAALGLTHFVRISECGPEP